MTYCFVVAVLALVGLTKKRFGHYAIVKILSLRSPRRHYGGLIVKTPLRKVDSFSVVKISDS